MRPTLIDPFHWFGRVVAAAVGGEVRFLPSYSTVKAPDAVREFTRGKSNSSPVGLNFPNIEVVLTPVVRIFNLDARFIRLTPFVIRDIYPVDQESLSVHAAANVSPDQCVHFKTNSPFDFC